MKGSLHNASQSFICRCCKVDRPITDGLNTDLHLDIGNWVSLEKVDKFCYLGDMLAGGIVLRMTWKLGLSQKDAQSRNKWRRIKGATG